MGDVIDINRAAKRAAVKTLDNGIRLAPKRQAYGPRPESNNLTGQRFTRLVVRGPAPKLGKHMAWLTKCDCGAERIVRGEALRNGRIKSCGCLRREAGRERGRASGEDLKGRTFGTVKGLGMAGERRDSKGHIQWHCECECGARYVSGSNDIKRSKSCVACGHLQRVMANEVIKELGGKREMRCTKCRQLGHKRTTCPNEAVVWKRQWHKSRYWRDTLGEDLRVRGKSRKPTI